MNKRKYAIGDIINDRKITNYVAGCYVVNCLLCGSTIKASAIDLEKNVCRCLYKNKRFSGRRYVNPPEKLKAIKEKYKNGITTEILNEFITV